MDIPKLTPDEVRHVQHMAAELLGRPATPADMRNIRVTRDAQGELLIEATGPLAAEVVRENTPPPSEGT
jgi:hypothetical protein